MTATTTLTVTLGTAPPTGRDRAILAAAAAGRCVITTGTAPTLMIDGCCCADQFAARRLTSAGWISPAPPTGRTSCATTVPVCLTRTGTAALRDDVGPRPLRATGDLSA